ncbi:MAG: hypothetical protein EBQ96_00370 [Proteobacteria bacterium]|nr:hypothetical protein [Pseudomonadota bacterium]
MNRFASSILATFALAVAFIGYHHGKAPKGNITSPPQASDVLRSMSATEVRLKSEAATRYLSILKPFSIGTDGTRGASLNNIGQVVETLSKGNTHNVERLKKAYADFEIAAYAARHLSTLKDKQLVEAMQMGQPGYQLHLALTQLQFVLYRGGSSTLSETTAEAAFLKAAASYPDVLALGTLRTLSAHHMHFLGSVDASGHSQYMDRIKPLLDSLPKIKAEIGTKTVLAVAATKDGTKSIEMAPVTIEGTPAVKGVTAALTDKRTIAAIKAVRAYLKISEHQDDVTQLEQRAAAIGGSDPRAFRAATISAHRVLSMLTAHPAFLNTHPDHRAFMLAHESNIARIKTLETTLAAYFKEEPIQNIRCGTGKRGLKLDGCGY